MSTLLDRIVREQRKQEWIEFNSDLFNEILGSYTYIGSGRARIDFRLYEELYFKFKEIAEQKTNTRIRVYDDGCTVFCDGKRIDGLKPMQKRLLNVLARHDCAVTRERLIDEVWSESDTSLWALYNLVCTTNRALALAGFRFMIKGGSGIYRIVFIGSKPAQKKQ